MSERIRGSYDDAGYTNRRILYKGLQGACNKVLNCWDVTLLARRVLPLVSYVAPWSATDDDKTTDGEQNNTAWLPTLVMLVILWIANLLLAFCTNTPISIFTLFYVCFIVSSALCIWRRVRFVTA